jgi:hypothetical protein
MMQGLNMDKHGKTARGLASENTDLLLCDEGESFHVYSYSSTHCRVLIRQSMYL